MGVDRSGSAGRRPGNVLFVTLDQYRGDCVSALGHPVVRTPTLDRLVAEGVAFTRHWATTAPCGPSRASLYTGLYAMNHRSVLNGTPLDARLTNVALEARRLGCAPALFGYTDATVDPTTVEDPDDPRLRTYEGVLPGFDPVLHLPFERPTPWLDHLVANGVAVDGPGRGTADAPADVPTPPGRGATWAPARYPAELSESAFVTDAVLDWLAERGDEPWFAHVSYARPHPPYRAPAPWHDLHDPADVPPPVGAPTREAEAAVHPLAAVAVRLPGVAAPDDELDRRQLRATYYGMVGEVDHQLGRLLDGLAAQGRDADTLVVVTADHGEQLGDHWVVEKLAWFDETYHVPLVVRDPLAPGRAAGRRVSARTEHVDVAPTILDWLGADVPVAWDGRSLLPFVRGDGTAPDRWRTEHHAEWDFRDPGGRAAEELFGCAAEECCLVVLRDDRWKYVHVAAPSLPDLLFDLRADPHQVHDLHADPDHAPVVAELAGRVLSWRMRHADRRLTVTRVGPDGPATHVDPRVG